MSELEKKNVSGAGPGSSVVMVESPGNKYLQSFRPTELQEESPPDHHHKRSRAPAVPSVAEELKNIISEDVTTNDNAVNKERKDTEREHEKQKRTVSKKLSTSTKRRGSSPETITLAPLEVDTKKAIENVARQPIPPDVEAVASAASAVTGSKQPKQSNSEEDSITEDVAELRTEGKKREWTSDVKSKIKLEGKASIGPCFKYNEKPSGIAICMPMKSSRYVSERLSDKYESGISIQISRRVIPNKSKSNIDNSKSFQNNESKHEKPTEDNKVTENMNENIFENLKGKFRNVWVKIKQVFVESNE